MIYSINIFTLTEQLLCTKPYARNKLNIYSMPKTILFALENKSISKTLFLSLYIAKCSITC